MQSIGSSGTGLGSGPHPPAAAQGLGGTPRGSAGQLQGQVPFGLQQQQQQQVMLQRQYLLQQQQLLMQQQVHPHSLCVAGKQAKRNCHYLVI